MLLRLHGRTAAEPNALKPAIMFSFPIGKFTFPEPPIAPRSSRSGRYGPRRTVRCGRLEPCTAARGLNRPRRDQPLGAMADHIDDLVEAGTVEARGGDLARNAFDMGEDELRQG